MEDMPFGEFMRRRRAMLGLTQRDLAARVGVSQPAIAAIESGRKAAGEDLRARITGALAMYPSLALEHHAAAVVEVFSRHGLPHPKVFGSIATGTETPSSDVDLLVPLTKSRRFAYTDLFEMERELKRLLTFDVDIVDDATAPPEFRDRVRGEAVPV